MKACVGNIKKSAHHPHCPSPSHVVSFALFRSLLQLKSHFFLTRSVYTGSRKSCDHRLCVNGAFWWVQPLQVIHTHLHRVVAATSFRGADSGSGAVTTPPKDAAAGSNSGVQCLQGHFRSSAARARHRNIDLVITMIARLFDPLLLGLNK